MADISVNIEPGQYFTSQSLTVTFPPNSRRAIITRDDRSPVLTEILAYDTGYLLPIPSNPNPDIGEGPIVERPFMAVTQDGRGNVIYDGGFPKFYNSHIRTANGGSYPATLPTTLAGLAPACKYLLNALSFIANPRKTAQGNRKILFLNNCLRNGQYNILKSHYNPDPLQNNAGDDGFRDTFDAVCNIGGWIPTYFDATSQGGAPIDVTLTTMEQYAAVVFLASRGENKAGESWITPACTAAIAQYRAAGSGVAIITDHCSDNYTNLQDAITRGAIFGGDATKVAQHFGAYFSGDVARRPVQVAEIRRQIGLPGPPEDHPLLAGMADSEYIFAGGSESLIIPELFENDVVDHEQPWSIAFTTPGTYRVNVLVQLDDGTIITKPMRFVIINPSDILLKDSFNRTVTNTSQTYKPVIDYTLDTTANGTPTVTGEIRIDTMLVGYFTTSIVDGIANTSYQPLGGNGVPMPIQNGQVVKFAIKEPFEFTTSYTVTIPDRAPYANASTGISTFSKLIAEHPYFAGLNINQAYSDLTAFTDKCYTTARNIGTTILGLWWKVMGKARLPFMDSELLPVRVKVYTTEAAWTAAKPAVGNIGDAVIIAANNKVYYWDNLPMTWSAHPNNAATLFTLQRKVVNLLDNSNWVIGTSSTTKVT